jgi:hypothetical protein
MQRLSPRDPLLIYNSLGHKDSPPNLQRPEQRPYNFLNFQTSTGDVIVLQFPFQADFECVICVLVRQTRGSVLTETLCNKLDGPGFDIRRGE